MKIDFVHVVDAAAAPKLAGLCRVFVIVIAAGLMYSEIGVGKSCASFPRWNNRYLSFYSMLTNRFGACVHTPTHTMCVILARRICYLSFIIFVLLCFNDVGGGGGGMDHERNENTMAFDKMENYGRTCSSVHVRLICARRVSVCWSLGKNGAAVGQ